ncbi:glycoside hydrolase domain-containing protein [Pseudoscardovia radai]|uniref:glycoside hydrolase domain-containing protein n=3 Tax=Pseudoscardovia radai TaxID=987066 RepID=UPI00399143D3
MTDQMVLATQKWLNKTYVGRNGYNVVQENGRTGWEVVHGLLRALQIELGISVPSDNFGPGTTARYQAAPLAKPALKGATSNKYAILQGALWCKGYDAGHYGDLDDHYDDKVAAAVASLQADAGIGGDGSTVSVNLMKALLSMDQFRLIPGSGGDASVRSFQQELNGGFEAYSGLIPCDGIYDRGTNEAVIYAIQALEDMPVDVANGYFGPSTRSHCPDLDYSHGQVSYTGAVYSDARIRRFCRIANFCMYVNGFPSGTQADPFPEKIDPARVREFQRKYAVAETGRINLSTWLSLCVSCGDTSRKGTACDTRFEITDAHAETLVANHYKYVGRYLTGGDFKQIRAGELQTIFRHGLIPFFIFEEGYEKEYFTAAQGKNDARSASAAAGGFHAPADAAIFFAVDFDAMDGDVTTNVLPYFEAIHSSIGSYRIGVYGPRNVCTRVCEAGYAEFSFVSDMSSGFSGNMGYPIPDGWSIDQISNVTITHGNDSLEIDNDLVSAGGMDDAAVSRLLASTVTIHVNSREYDPTISQEWYQPMINRWTGDVPINDDFDSSRVIGYIHPNDFYVRLLMSHQYHFFVAVSDGVGGLIQGVLNGVEVYRGDDSVLFPWYDSQESFLDWNSDGNGISLSSSSAVTIDTMTDCRVFKLRHPALWLWTTSQESQRVGGVLPMNAEVAIERSLPQLGKSNPNFILCKRWRYANSSSWQSFHDESNGVEVENPFVDLGFQYGCSPSDRLLM